MPPRHPAVPPHPREGIFLVFKTRKIATEQFSESGFVIYLLLFAGVITPAVTLGLMLTALARVLFNVRIVSSVLKIFLVSFYGLGVRSRCLP